MIASKPSLDAVAKVTDDFDDREYSLLGLGWPILE